MQKKPGFGSDLIEFQPHFFLIQGKEHTGSGSDPKYPDPDPQPSLRAEKKGPNFPPFSRESFNFFIVFRGKRSLCDKKGNGIGCFKEIKSEQIYLPLDYDTTR